MRHLWSLLAGVVAAPVAWLLLATGQHRSQRLAELWNASGRYDTMDLIGPVAFIAVAGILLGLLGTLRWSPAGPVTAGILLIAPTVLMFMDPLRTMEGFLRPPDGGTRRFLYQDLQPWLPVENGTLLLLGALLLMAVFSAQRWRRWPERGTSTQPGSGQAGAGKPTPTATDDEVIAGISSLGGARSGSTPSGSTAPPVAAKSTTASPAGGSGTAGGGSDGGSSGLAMTDDEILAAAAAFEAADQPDRPTAPLPRRTPGSSRGPGSSRLGSGKSGSGNLGGSGPASGSGTTGSGTADTEADRPGTP